VTARHRVPQYRFTPRHDRFQSGGRHDCYGTSQVVDQGEQFGPLQSQIKAPTRLVKNPVGRDQNCGLLRQHDRAGTSTEHRRDENGGIEHQR